MKKLIIALVLVASAQVLQAQILRPVKWSYAGYFENQAVFQQKIKLKSKNQAAVRGSIQFGACDDNECIPPEDVNFIVTVK